MPNGFIRPQEISFPVFTYGTQAELIIDCEVFLCEAGSALCDVDFANCLNVQTLSRRRRSVPKQKISVSYSFLPLPKIIMFFRTSLLELPFKTVLRKLHFYLHCLFFFCKIKINILLSTAENISFNQKQESNLKQALLYLYYVSLSTSI